MNQWNAAVIGAGFIGRVHLEAIRWLSHIQIVALAVPELEKARELGKEFSVRRVEPEFRGILQDQLNDAAHVCTPNHLHSAVAKAALEALEYVIFDRPLATTAKPSSWAKSSWWGVSIPRHDWWRLATGTDALPGRRTGNPATWPISVRTGSI